MPNSRVNDIRISLVQQFIDFLNRILRTLLRPVAVSIWLQIRFPGAKAKSVPESTSQRFALLDPE
jgi:hypothetical protein